MESPVISAAKEKDLRIVSSPPTSPASSPLLSKYNSITFSIKGDVSAGHRVRMIAKSNNGWNYDHGWDMTTEGPDGADAPTWQITISLPRKTVFEYCYTVTDGIDFFHVSSIRRHTVKETSSKINDGGFGTFSKPDLKSSTSDDVHWISSSHHFRIVLGYPETYLLKSGHPFVGIDSLHNNSITEITTFVQDVSSTTPISQKTTPVSNIHDTFNFRVARISGTTSLHFDFKSTTGSIGKAVVLVSQLATAGNGVMTVPILDQSFMVIGTTSFIYTHTTPFIHPSFLETAIITRRAPFPAKQNLVGHRGSGSTSSQALTVDKFVRSHIKENTILSFTQAGERGATFVEFDVHLTSDLVPVIYHDFTVEMAEPAVPVPIHSVTLEKFQSMGRRKVQGNKTLLDVKRGAPAQPIFDSFPTLRDTLLKVPQNIGFNIEIKYPIKDEVDKYNISPVDRNTYLDRILWEVFEYAKTRNIYFSSFDPDICLMLVQKQPLYPVLFLSQMGTTIRSDPRCNSPEASITFATSHGLAGLVCPATFVLNNPEVVKQIKEAGLELGSWGVDNNNPENVRKQLDLGLNAAIVDHVAHIAKHTFSPVPSRPQLVV